jgi:hypothetical protein
LWTQYIYFFELFERAIKYAHDYKNNPNDDFLENVMETINYFELQVKYRGGESRHKFVVSPRHIKIIDRVLRLKFFKKNFF